MTDLQKSVSIDLPAIAVDPAAFSVPVGARFKDDVTASGNALVLDGLYEDFMIISFALTTAYGINLAGLKPGQRLGFVTKQASGASYTSAFWDSRIIWQNGVAGSFTTGVGRPSGKFTYDYTEFLCIAELVPGTPATGLVLGRQVKNFPAA